MIADFEQKVNLRQETAPTLEQIERFDRGMEDYFRAKFLVQPALNRQLVSFQANKSRPVYRWYKYKEGFSAGLMEYLFCKYHIANGRILDPFAGSGTSLFVASDLGLDADGIELLLGRIRRSFGALDAVPHLFFVGNAIEASMAGEIWDQLTSGELANAANLTDNSQTMSLVAWLCKL